jgi:hypothetical protein
MYDLNKITVHIAATNAEQNCAAKTPSMPHCQTSTKRMLHPIVIRLVTKEKIMVNLALC